MAPRGRSRKVGLKRIDAAVDALLPLGFSRDVIRKAVNALLKVYDGDEGWVFIEEGSYKLLIETILERQEKAEEKPDDDDTSENGSREHGVSETLTVERAKEVADVGETSTVPEVVGLKTETGSQKDVGRIDISCVTQGLGLELVRRDSEAASGHVQPLTTPVIRRRKPCYGWISDDDDDIEEDDTSTGLVVFPKAETMPTVNMVDLGGGRKRKPCWDVKPEVT